LIGLVQEGWEGAVGAKKIIDERTESVWYRMHKMQFPQDRAQPDGVPSFTTFTGHSEYLTDALYEATEKLLQGEIGPDEVKQAAHGSRVKPQCRRIGEVCIDVKGCDQKVDCNALLQDGVNEATCTAAGGRWVTAGGFGMWTERVGEIWFDGFGVGPGTDEGDDDAHCAVRMLLDLNGGKLDCGDDGWCTVPYYLRAGKDGTTTAFTASEAPQTIRDAFEATPFTPKGQTYEATQYGRSRHTRFGPPDETAQKPCFDKPGPANDDLFCTRLEGGHWIGFKWYRFVDQPELNQVFASLPAGERKAAKCFMQSRIEQLHKSQGTDSVPRWFDAPQGADNLPADKVKIDQGLLLTPPEGLEHGYVPIPIVEMMVKPADCVQVQGCFTEEDEDDPGVDPTTVHHEGNADKPNLWWRGHEFEMCPANEESGRDFARVGPVYPYSNSANPWEDRTQYTVPLRAEVRDTLDEAVTCGSGNGKLESIAASAAESTCYAGYVIPVFTMPPTPPPTPPPPPSCAGNCGESGGGYCWCDAGCVNNGDCCDDYVRKNMCVDSLRVEALLLIALFLLSLHHMQ
jgi:hypothetical protein